MLKESHHKRNGVDTSLEGLIVPRHGLKLAALSLSDGAEKPKVVTAHLPSAEFSTPLVSHLGSFITAFTHRERSYVVRFAEHGREISILPAGDEQSGISSNSDRLFVSTIPTDLGHILLTPFAGTGVPRFLTKLAVEHALASTGHATAHVRFAQIKNVLEKCGLSESFRIPIHQPERLEAEAHGREQISKGFQYNYDSAIMLKDKVVMSRSLTKEEREKCKHWNLFSTIRLIEHCNGKHLERHIPRN
jgi:hypothetical protein